MVTISSNKCWPISRPVEYLDDNTVTYRMAYTRDELIAALWRAERRIKRQMAAQVDSIDMEGAIRNVLQEYWDSLGLKK